MESALYDSMLKDEAYAMIDVLPKDQWMAVSALFQKLEAKGTRVFYHSLRVGSLVGIIDRFLGIESDDLLAGGYLHDVGKVKIPLRILEKTGTWTNNDRTIMKRHVLTGYRRLKECGLADAADIMVFHHWFQIPRYPRRIPKPDYSHNLNRVRFCGRIVALADCYDALHRNNAWPEGIVLDSSQIRNKMFALNLDQSQLIGKLYNAGIFV